MSAIFENILTIMTTDFGYFKSLYDFFFNVDEFLSPTAKEKLFRSEEYRAYEILLQSESLRTFAKKRILKKLQLSESINFDINSEIVRLVICENSILKNVIAATGAMFYHSDIGKVIGKKSLDELCQFIGSKTYSFIIKRGLMLWKMIPELKIDEANGNSLIEKISYAGKTILCQALIGLPLEVKKRLELIVGYKFEIPKLTDEIIRKQCLEIINFAIEKFKNQTFG